MWGRSANWIEHLIANHKVYVCTIRTERVVTGQTQIWTGLPPSVLTANNPISKASVQMGASPDSPPRSSDRYPFALLDLVYSAVAGFISTTGSGITRRRRLRFRC
jgi:hypothetical protein